MLSLTATAQGIAQASLCLDSRLIKRALELSTIKISSAIELHSDNGEVVARLYKWYDQILILPPKDSQTITASNNVIAEAAEAFIRFHGELAKWGDWEGVLKAALIGERYIAGNVTLDGGTVLLTRGWVTVKRTLGHEFITDVVESWQEHKGKVCVVPSGEQQQRLEEALSTQTRVTRKPLPDLDAYFIKTNNGYRFISPTGTDSETLVRHFINTL